MDLKTARAAVADDIREQDPERFVGECDDSVLLSLAQDGVDVNEVRSWAETGIVPDSLIHAYVMVIEN